MTKLKDFIPEQEIRVGSTRWQTWNNYEKSILDNLWRKFKNGKILKDSHGSGGYHYLIDDEMYIELRISTDHMNNDLMNYTTESAPNHNWENPRKLSDLKLGYHDSYAPQSEKFEAFDLNKRKRVFQKFINTIIKYTNN